MIVLCYLESVLSFASPSRFEASFRYEGNKYEEDHCRNPHHRQVVIKI